MVFHWNLSDSKSPQVSRTLLSIPASINNAVVWIVSTCLVISKSSSLCTNSLVTVPRAAITVGINVTFIFHSFFNSSARCWYLFFFFFFTSFQFYSAVSQDSKVHNSASSLFLLIIIRPGLLADNWWSVCMSKSHRSFCVSFSCTDAGLCIYHLFVGLNFNFLHDSQWITFSTQSCLVSDNSLHSFIM